MKKTTLALGLTALLLGSATPAAGQTMAETIKCMGEAVKDCDAAFGADDYYLIAIRGWCYMIGTGICLVT